MRRSTNGTHPLLIHFVEFRCIVLRYIAVSLFAAFLSRIFGAWFGKRGLQALGLTLSTSDGCRIEQEVAKFELAVGKSEDVRFPMFVPSLSW
eukprot:COSAG06_NODE_1813_length_8305_cov_5.110407_3_plen_92_part_00